MATNITLLDLVHAVAEDSRSNGPWRGLLESNWEVGAPKSTAKASRIAS